MKTVKLTTENNPHDDHQLEVLVDGETLGRIFSDIPYESSDAWAVYTVLKGLHEAGAINLECEPAIAAWYEKGDRPATVYVMGPAGPCGMTGKCECADRVSTLEKAVEILILTKEDKAGE